MSLIATEELMHYGVKGMKWGVRRYQNYDGSYTKRGLKRYYQAESDYENAKKERSRVKSEYKNGTKTRQDYKKARQNVRSTKKALVKSYNKLKTDKLADEGKKLYQRGKTITSNTKTTYTVEAGIVVGSTVANQMLRSYGNQRVAGIATSAIAIGGSAINALLATKASSENKKLRAYYSHS